MKKIFYSILTVLLFLGIFTGCDTLDIGQSPGTTQNTASSEHSNIISTLLHESYIEESGISVYHAFKRKRIPDQIESLLSKEPVRIKNEPGKIFSPDFFAVTSEPDSNYYYYGSIKDNRPDGIGVLTSGIANLNDITGINNLIYAGSFTKGVYDGYGVLFQKSDTDTLSDIADISDIAGLEGTDRSILEIYLAKYVTYDGDFKKGVKTGKGNFFNISLLPTNDVANIIYPLVAVSEVKKDEMDGKMKYYEKGILIYDGESKKGYRDGKGVLYYLNGQKKYDGEWRRDEYHGKGTLYDENGNVIYEGNWKNGDYAS